MQKPIHTRWWWVRHAPVTVDNGHIYGQSDLPCDTTDAPTFAALAKALPRNAIWVISNLMRTRQTADAILKVSLPTAPQPDFEIVPAFAEQHLGQWQGLPRAAFLADRGFAGSYWFAAAEECAPEGESFLDLVSRVKPEMDRLTAAHPTRDIIAVAHGGTIRAALSLALGIAPQATLALAINNCSLTRIDHVIIGETSGWRVAGVNMRA